MKPISLMILMIAFLLAGISNITGNDLFLHIGVSVFILAGLSDVWVLKKGVGKMKKDSWLDKISAYVIGCAFIVLFFVIAYAVFAVMPREYYWLGGIIAMVTLFFGLIIMTRIKLPGDKKDL